MAQASALVIATQRSQGRAVALQAQAIRMAVWGEQEDFRRFTRAVSGESQTVGAGGGNDAGERDAALAAFGLRALPNGDADDERDAQQNRNRADQQRSQGGDAEQQQ